MTVPSFDVAYDEDRDRLSVAFRFILAIPHLLIAGAWSYLAQILALVQWFVILFTGRRHRGIWDLQRSWLAYAARVWGYALLLFDPWPAIGPDRGDEPTTFDIAYSEQADRLTSALRVLWAIPAIIVYTVIAIALYAVALVSWFAIVITGRHPRGMFDFLLRGARNYLRLQAYVLLMDDTYPWFRGDEPTSVGGSAPAAGSPLPPPPAPGQGWNVT